MLVICLGLMWEIFMYSCIYVRLTPLYPLELLYAKVEIQYRLNMQKCTEYQKVISDVFYTHITKRLDKFTELISFYNNES